MIPQMKCMKKIKSEVENKKKGRSDGWSRKREREQEVQSTGGGGMRQRMRGDGGRDKKCVFAKKTRPSGEMELH